MAEILLTVSSKLFSWVKKAENSTFTELSYLLSYLLPSWQYINIGFVNAFRRTGNKLLSEQMAAEFTDANLRHSASKMIITAFRSALRTCSFAISVMLKTPC